MKLFEISSTLEWLFDEFDSIENMEFEVNEDGEPIDSNGNIIDPIEEREKLRKSWSDEFAKVEEDFNVKAEGIAQYVKGLKVEADAIDEEIKKLRKKKEQRVNKIEYMKQYLQNCMTSAGIKKIDGIHATVSVRKNASSLKIADEAAFVTMLQEIGRDDLLKYSEPELRKSDIKSQIKNGAKFDGAWLESAESLIIK